MRSLRDTPIRQKLILISLLASGAALLLACAGFVVSELVAYREATLRKLSAVAGVIAANSSAALSFEDPKSAEATLSALRAEKQVVGACIYSADETLFATYYSDDTLDDCSARYRKGSEDHLEGNQIAVSVSIGFDEEAIGTIVIRSDPIDIYERLPRYASCSYAAEINRSVSSHPMHPSVIDTPYLSCDGSLSSFC